MPDDSCQKCPDYSYADNEIPQSCITDECVPLSEALNKGGKCTALVSSEDAAALAELVSGYE